MAIEIGVRELKNNATQIVRSVREERAEYIVTVHGRRVAVLRAIELEDEERARRTKADAFLAGLEALSREMVRFPRSRTALDQLLEDRGED